MNSHLLFVYGTLQEELGSDMSKFLSRNSENIGKGFILGKLYKISWFPGVVLSDAVFEKVYGTVFKLKNPLEKTLKVLDNYEGFNAKNPKESLYIREKTIVFLENEESKTCWVYIYNQNIKDHPRITSGYFLKDAKT